MRQRPSEDTLAQLVAIVGEAQAIRDPVAMDGYMREWRQIWHGRSPLVLRPGSTLEVSRIMALAHATGTAIVPQSGNTGLCGGQTVTDDGTEVLLSLDRMTGIIDADPSDNTVTVEEGRALQGRMAVLLAAIDQITMNFIRADHDILLQAHLGHAL